MTDYRIEDIPGGELTAIAADDKLVILDKSDTTDDTDGTTKYVELASLGLLATGSSKTSSFTAEVGVLHPVNVTTAQIIVTFPSAVAGDTFGYFVQVESTTAGDFAQAPGKAIEPATGSIINNVSYTQLSSGSNKWGLWFESECLIFRYYDATVGWQVVHDGRIPIIAFVEQTAIQSVDNATWTLGVLDTVGVDTGNVFDATNDYFDVKRSGLYSLRGSVRFDQSTTGGRCLAGIGTTAAGNDLAVGETNYPNAPTTLYGYAHALSYRNLTASGTSFITLSIYQNTGAAHNMSRKELSFAEMI